MSDEEEYIELDIRTETVPLEEAFRSIYKSVDGMYGNLMHPDKRAEKERLKARVDVLCLVLLGKLPILHRHC